MKGNKMSIISKELSKNIKAARNSEGHFIARRVISDIKRGKFSSVEELNNQLNDVISAINDTRPYFIELQSQKESCEHKFNDGNYYDMRMVMGDYIRKFEHTCVKCCHVETKRSELNDLDAPFPEGFGSCKRGYYNNNI